MKRVALIHGGWLSAKNGLNTVVNFLLNSNDAFLEKGIEIIRYSYDDLYPRSFGDAATVNFKYRVRTTLKNVLIKLSKYSSFISWVLIKKSLLSGAEIVVRKYISTNPSENEVAFFHSIFSCYYFLKNRKKNQPVVVVIHSNGDNLQQIRIDYPKLTASKYYGILEKMSDYVLENADRFCLVSEGSRNTFLKQYPQVDKNKVFFIYNGIAMSPNTQKSSLSNPIDICCVGSICYRKGQHLLVESMIKMKQKGLPNIHFTIVGGGDTKNDLENRVKQNHLEQYFSFVGEKNDVTSFLEASDIFILPSYDEGLPMAIIEAMRASLPIVATNVGGVAEMVEDKVNGLLIAPEVDSICSFIQSINIYDWVKMGEQARKTFEEKFSGDKMIDGYSTLLLSV